MKKLVVLFFAMIILCAAASADFLVESFTIGYSNTTLNVKSLYTKAPAPVEKVNLPITMHQVAVMPIFAGFGYMPKDKGFYFMWEHILGVGNVRFSRKSEIVRGIGGKTSSKSLSWVNSFICFPTDKNYLRFFREWILFGLFWVRCFVGELCDWYVRS